MELKRENVNTLLHDSLYIDAKKVEAAKKCLAAALKDRNDYYDPLLVPVPSMAESRKRIREAKYMHAYPVNEDRVTSDEKRNMETECLRGDDYYKDWL